MKKLILALALGSGILAANQTLAADKKLVLVAGTVSHGPGDHEFNAGTLLLKKCLDGFPGLQTIVYTNGWPKAVDAFEGADAVLLYMDGGPGHPLIKDNNLQQIEALVKKGVSFGCAHYAVEIPKDKGGPELKSWIGGFYENGFSVNPMWSPEFKQFPNHPISRGVKPFSIRDEWYFNMNFRPNMEGVTPILVAKPSDDVRKGPYVYPAGPYPHIVQASGRDEIMMWAVDRPDGGRGLGFTGGHRHANWGDPNFRKVMLNALVWLAKLEVPADGVESSVSEDDLKKNLDPKPAKKTAAPAERGSGPAAALADLKSLKAHPGLEVSVFASEPMLRNPTDMDIDAKGRVWVLEGVNYRSSFQKWGIIRPEGDRIVILEDSDGDGLADKEKVFYQGKEINAALGICVLGNRVIVSCSPNIFVFTDLDGDDKADTKEVMFSGISGVDHDHGVHAFIFGPDGKLYFNMGNDSKQLKTADGSKFIVDKAGNEVRNVGKPYRQGLVFRCNPDGSELETVGWNFRNNYEVSVDSFGTLWQSDNDDDGNKSVRINYVMEFGNYGFADELTGAAWGQAWRKAQESGKLDDSQKPRFHWHMDDPGVVPTLLVTGAGSPTGITVYEGTLLPEVFRGQMIHCDAGPNVVRSYPVKAQGAGYTAEMVDLVKGSDSWFRPSDVCVGPDGSVFIADWNDAGVGGHHMADQKFETMRGRVYRVAPAGHKLQKPKLDLETPAGRLAALQSPNMSTRYLAWQTLNMMQRDAERELLKVWRGNDQTMRARALHLLARIPGKESKYIGQAIKDKNSDIRITGLRIARQSEIDLIPVILKLSRDNSPAVRRECLIALRHNNASQAPKIWADLALAHQAGDRWYLEALGIAADKQEDKFFNAWLESAGNQWNSAAGREIVWRSRAAKAPALLAKLIKDPKTTEADKARYLRSLDYIQGPEKDAALLEVIGLN